MSDPRDVYVECPSCHDRLNPTRLYRDGVSVIGFSIWSECDCSCGARVGLKGNVWVVVEK